MVPFFQICPSLAMQETRSFILPEGPRGSIPAGEYGLLESYCTEPDCDCQRVLFSVIKRNSDRVEATISMGFDPEDDMSEAMLDPINPQGAHAEEILAFVTAMIANDAEYLERLKRHYAITKQIVSGQLRTQDAPASHVIQGMKLVDSLGISLRPEGAFRPSTPDIPAPQFMNRAERRRREKESRRKR